MKFRMLLLLLSVSLPVFCEDAPASSEPVELGFFSKINAPVPVSNTGRTLVEDSVFWSWMSIGGFGASTLSFIVTHYIDDNVGGALSLVSVGFWSVSHFASAFTHRKISIDLKSEYPDAQRPVTAGVASLVAGVLGAGAVTAVSLMYSDVTDAAKIAAYVSFGLSALTGGYGIYKTFEYAAATGIDLSFF